MHHSLGQEELLHAGVPAERGNFQVYEHSWFAGASLPPRSFHDANLCCTSPLLPARHHMSPLSPQVLSPSCWSTAGLHRCTSISSPQAVSRPPPPNTPHYCSSLMDIDRSQWALSVSLTIWIPAPPQPYEILTPTSTGQSHGSMPPAEWGAPNFEEGGSGFLASFKSGLTSVKVLR